MKLMSIVENITSLTMVLTIVFMIVMTVIYFRKKINETENKIESMFDLVETLTIEVKNLKTIKNNNLMGDILNTTITNPDQLFSLSSQSEIISMETDNYEEDDESDDDSENEEVKEVTMDYTVDSNKEEESEDEDDDDEDEDEDEEDEDEKVSDEDVENYLKLARGELVIDNEEEEEEEEQEEENDIHVEKLETSVSDSILQLEEMPVKRIDLSEINVESELNDISNDYDYSKMTVKELKQLLINKGYNNDITKMKRNGLINLLNEQ